MSDFTEFKKILDHQQKVGVKKDDWLKCGYRVERDEYINLAIDSMEVGFCFTLKGQFLGIYNWKQ